MPIIRAARLIPFLLVTLVPLPCAQCADRRVDHVVLVSVDGLAASYLTDRRAHMPHLRAIAAEGAAAEGMLTSFPSVTWPSHTSLVTGATPARHGVVGNRTWNRRTNALVTYIGDGTLTKDEAIRVPTLYDVVHQAGLSTASVIWPCSNGAKTLDWIIPDSNQQDLHDRYTTPGFADELAAAGIDISPLGAWGWNKDRSTERDLVYTAVTKHLLTKHKVNLILLHLITPDGVEHAYGPQTPAAYQAVAESDQRIGELWQTLQTPSLRGKSALFVVSDHGFAPYEKLIQPNVFLKDLGLITLDDSGEVARRDAWCVEQGGAAFIYVLDEARRDDITAALREKLGAVEGVLAVMGPDEFTELGVPHPDANPEAPHLILTTGPGYQFTREVTGAVIADAGGLKGSHGHDPRPDYMHAMFVAAGAGIKPGAKLDVIRNIDVAPTIARLLGVEMPSAEGRVLEAALSD
ncbi:MAG: alkaline phosphatase family protein [Planctomycetaceae bacterium]